MSSKYIGIDVSDNQQVIDWEKVAGEGCQFAILRSVRHSGKTDYQFQANLTGCRDNNIPVAVYKYTYAKTVAEAETEANQVVELLEKSNLVCKVFWDVEDRDYLCKLGKNKLTEVIKAAQHVIENAGLEFCLYTGLYVYKENWFDFSQFSCPLWVARYPVSGTKTLQDFPAEKYTPDVGREIYGWQFSSEGRIDGISTNVDLNVLYCDPVTLGGSAVSDKGSDNAQGIEEGYVFMTCEIDKSQAEQLLGTTKIMNIMGKLYRTV
ncbi:MAG: hypothetical protein NC489_46250 [Ruminococcus flavefaciens]|nr:hypothetical protein [Ruminococcus flavefaciens]